MDWRTISTIGIVIKIVPHNRVTTGSVLIHNRGLHSLALVVVLLRVLREGIPATIEERVVRISVRRGEVLRLGDLMSVDCHWVSRSLIFHSRTQTFASRFLLQLKDFGIVFLYDRLYTIHNTHGRGQ